MVQIFVTGGTFDKEYDFISGELFFKDTHLREMFLRGRCTVDLNITTLMMVDSLEMTDVDREIIAHNCARSESENIIVTHGTDTMVLTAKHLSESKSLDGKTIVLTGAMVPYAFGSSSDGFFNLGSSLAFVQCLQPGVYIAMNGKYFNWDQVQKNRKTGYFEAI